MYFYLTPESQVYEIMLQEAEQPSPATTVPADSVEAMRVSTSCGDRNPL